MPGDKNFMSGMGKAVIQEKVKDPEKVEKKEVDNGNFTVEDYREKYKNDTRKRYDLTEEERAEYDRDLEAFKYLDEYSGQGNTKNEIKNTLELRDKIEGVLNPVYEKFLMENLEQFYITPGEKHPMFTGLNTIDKVEELLKNNGIDIKDLKIKVFLDDVTDSSNISISDNKGINISSLYFDSIHNGYSWIRRHDSYDKFRNISNFLAKEIEADKHRQ